MVYPGITKNILPWFEEMYKMFEYSFTPTVSTLFFFFTFLLFTAAARWAEVVMMSKNYVFVCVYVLDTFIKSQYKWSGQPG